MARPTALVVLKKHIHRHRKSDCHFALEKDNERTTRVIKSTQKAVAYMYSLGIKIAQYAIEQINRLPYVIH